tara:strand:- start:3 stop:314 length:312 start_codon:yes stop_codon:yes gene_type:complete
MEWINSLPNWVVKPRFEIVNRSQKRSYLKSSSKINKEVDEIEQMFLADLFLVGQDKLTYSDIYNFNLDEFKRVVKWHIEHGKHKNIKINDAYFVDAYKPLVKP